MSVLQANILLLITAAIWGFAFVAQRAGMAHLGPFSFNAIRFGLGSLSLLPLVLATRRQREFHPSLGRLVRSGALAGVVLFAGASLQQVGLVCTTAGKAGFITGLYVVLVPLLGLLWGERVYLPAWIGAISAVAGLYLLSVSEQLSISPGDLWITLGALFWALHVQLIARLTQSIDALPLAAMQFAVCSLLSFGAAWATETITWEAVRAAMVPLLYGSFMSVGIAYTLQVVAQRHASPTPAAIIMSLESPFAAFGGWLLLGETMEMRQIMGAALMLAGMLIAQIPTDAVRSLFRYPGRQVEESRR